MTEMLLTELAHQRAAELAARVRRHAATGTVPTDPRRTASRHDRVLARRVRAWVRWA